MLRRMVLVVLIWIYAYAYGMRSALIEHAAACYYVEY
jgi:hypothetical protein